MAEYQRHGGGARDTAAKEHVAAKEDVTRFLTWAKLVLISTPENPNKYAQEHGDLLKLIFGYSKRYIHRSRRA